MKKVLFSIILTAVLLCGGIVYAAELTEMVTSQGDILATINKTEMNYEVKKIKVRIWSNIRDYQDSEAISPVYESDQLLRFVIQKKIIGEHGFEILAMGKNGDARIIRRPLPSAKPLIPNSSLDRRPNPIFNLKIENQ